MKKTLTGYVEKPNGKGHFCVSLREVANEIEDVLFAERIVLKLKPHDHYRKVKVKIEITDESVGRKKKFGGS